VRKLLNKEGKKPRTEASTILCLVTACVLPHKCWHTALKKRHTRKNKATEHAKLGQENEGGQRKTRGTDCQETEAVLSEVESSSSEASQQ